AERMAAGSGDPEAVVLGNPRDRAPELMQRLVRPPDRVADVRVQLDHRREELGLEPPRQLELLRLGDQQLDRGRKCERLGVEDHHLLLDADGKWRALPKLLIDQEPKAKRRLNAAGRGPKRPTRARDPVREGLAAAGGEGLRAVQLVFSAQSAEKTGGPGQASGPPVSAPASRAGNGCLRGSAAPRGQGPSRTITRKKMAAVRA